jgi:hypothetical protein
MQNRKPCMVLVAVALVTCWAANAQEFAYDNMIGGRVSSPAPLSVPVLAYGGGINKQRSDPDLYFAHVVRNLKRQHIVCVHAMDGTFPRPQ